MKSTILIIVFCLLLISPLPGFSGESDSALVTKVSSMIAGNNKTQMTQSLEELQLKVQSCQKTKIKTQFQEEYCQEIFNAVSLLEQALAKD